jgi:uncharacterized protein YjbI with pentapeptide repeats
MADEQQLAVLRQGSLAWNAWKKQNPDVRVDLSGADLSNADLRGGANLSGADLSGANLSGVYLSRHSFPGTGEGFFPGSNLAGADLSGAFLFDADLAGVNLSGADLTRAHLNEANLRGAILIEAILSRANLQKANLASADLTRANLAGAGLSTADLFLANLSEADFNRANLARADLTRANLTRAGLRDANLMAANLVETNLTAADLTGCHVYGISAWNLKLERTEQKNLIITPYGEPEITVDNLEVAQFIYLLLNNKKIREVIDTIGKKVVLILGRFTPERKVVLDALREELRQRDYLPVLFDFDKPASKDLTGTVQTLANMGRFIIADLTDPSSVPHELATVVPTTPVPIQPILLKGQREYAMFVDLRERYHWVLKPCRYASEWMIADLTKRVIVRAEAKARKLRRVPPLA